MCAVRVSACLRSGARDDTRDLKFTIPNCVKRRGASCESQTTSYRSFPSPYCNLFSGHAKDNLHPWGPHSAPPCRKSPFVYRLWRFCASRTPSAIPRIPAPWSCPACSVRCLFIYFFALCRIYTGRGKDSLSGLSLPFANRLFFFPDNSVLGFGWLQRRRVRRHRDAAAAVHGRTQAAARVAKHNQPPHGPLRQAHYVQRKADVRKRQARNDQTRDECEAEAHLATRAQKHDEGVASADVTNMEQEEEQQDWRFLGASATQE